MTDAVYNPKGLPVEQLPAIYAFSNVVGGHEGLCYAMAEDGMVLGSHWCSYEGFVPVDLGVLEGYRSDRHEEYKKHYPNGYRMVFVRSSEVQGTAGLMKAFSLNQDHGRAIKLQELMRTWKRVIVEEYSCPLCDEPMIDGECVAKRDLGFH